jgi:tRNA-Thr(GGU) m(6)t(6)A37 methyltransferase TsaA
MSEKPVTAKSKKQKLPTYEFEAIGLAHTPFTQRFGIPRQPGLVPDAKGVLKINGHPDFKFALKRLEEFSHIWVLFVFHAHGGNKWKPTIRPPRLGGKEKAGVFSSRSPHRPNPIGISVMELEKIDFDAKGGPELHVKGVDLLDGTPILDVKPYIPYADSVPNANPGWAKEEIKRTEVEFVTLAIEKITAAESAGYEGLKDLIEQLLTIDPRPAFQKREMPPEAEESQGKEFGLLVKDFDVQWKIQNYHFVVYDLIKTTKKKANNKT